MTWGTVIRMACWASGHSRFAFNRILEAQERLRPEAVAAMQLAKLRMLVRHAYETVPYYRDLLDDCKLKPQDITTLEDFSRLPVLSKGVIRDLGAEGLCSTAFQPSQLEQTHTSGSTGQPLTFYRERDYEEWRMAGSWRAWRWGGWSPGDKIAWVWREYWSPDVATRLRKRANWWLTRRRLFNVHDMSETTLDRWSGELGRFNPKFVHGFPSALVHLAWHLLRKGIKLDSIQAVFSNGEMLQGDQREVIEHAFGAKVHNVYGSSEVHPIAAECRHGNLHLNSDLLVAELADGPPETELKRVVLTPLHAFGMPLLRYEVGDLARRISHNCSCGLPFPVLEGLVGRSADLFPLPDGRVVHGQILIAYMCGVRNVEAFQFRQTRKHLLHLRVVKGPAFDARSAGDIAQVRERVNRDLQIPVLIEYVPDIPRSSGGKFRYTVCEVNHA